MPRFDDYYEPRDWRNSKPLTSRERATDEFRAKALDRLFQLAGFAGYDQGITDKYGWWERFAWTEDERKQYERWWVQAFVNEFRTSVKRAESEFSAFIYIYDWAPKKSSPPATQSPSPAPRTRKARPILLDYPRLA
jgi:hypothetical protein